MGLGASNVKHLTVLVPDPGADNKKVHLLKADQRLTILRGHVAVQNAQGAGSAGEFALLNYGTAGTAIKAGAAGTIAAALGGTAVSARLSAATPAAYTVGKPDVAVDEWVVLDYQETGDFVEGVVSVHLEYVDGDASAA